MAQPSNNRRAAAVPLGDREPRRAGGGWLKWLLPLLALLLVLVLVLAMRLGGDDDASTSGDRSTATAAATATSEASAGTSDAGAATLTAGDRPLRGDDAESLTAAVGQQAEGTGATVLSVVSGTGFWVGSSDADRVFVEYGSTVGTDESQPYKPKVGDVVALSGEVRPAPADPAQTLKLGAPDAEQVKAQGAYINAQDVQAQ
ncbi:hypothetical protein OJ997_09720 [Solirubrobacter phytolaccae]|uniref:Uncharacterized protein n=1 Tax=Solirubrobacter phytolaccae TaxID=1404360 RepID=A0A9X3N6M3_9ACTN|nr:hypothetical protein [Solirubrobacter phytolaccae]MDA0180569.1 hypothetical protein [Solirubrobacter phytolaccae]